MNDDQIYLQGGNELPKGRTLVRFVMPFTVEIPGGWQAELRDGSHLILERDFHVMREKAITIAQKIVAELLEKSRTIHLSATTIDIARNTVAEIIFKELK